MKQMRDFKNAPLASYAFIAAAAWLAVELIRTLFPEISRWLSFPAVLLFLILAALIVLFRHQEA